VDVSVPAVGVVLPQTDVSPRRPSLLPPGEFAELAESLGYESVWMSEGWGRDSFVQLTKMATATEKIAVGTSVVNTFSRSPAVLAMAAASIADAAPGRIRLGVGASHPGLIEDLHGLPYRRPVRRTEEVIKLVGAYTDADRETVEYDGEVFDASGFAPLDVDVPVYNAALGERNRRLTGRLCEGWLPFTIPVPALEAAFESVAAGARDAGRDPSEITVSPWVSAAVSEEPERARQVIREHLAGYVGSMGDDTYKGALAQQFPDAAERIAEAWRRGDETAAAAHVTDDLLNALAVVGSPEEARGQLREVLDTAVIDVPILSIPFEADEAMARTTVDALGPETLAE